MSALAGSPEGSLQEQYAILEAASDVIAQAPEDEVTAEILALQGELLHQVHFVGDEAVYSSRSAGTRVKVKQAALTGADGLARHDAGA